MALYGSFWFASMINPQQIRMARAGLRWTIDDLSLKSDVGTSTIKRLESADENFSANIKTLSKIEACLKYAGVEFIERDDGARGIFMRTTSRE